VFCSLSFEVSSFDNRHTLSIWHHYIKISLTVWCTINVVISFSCQALPKELVRSRYVVSILYENKAQLNSVSMHLGKIVGMAILSFLLV